MDTSVAKVVKSFFEGYPTVNYEKSELLYRPDTELTHVFYILQGQVAEYDISSVGNEVIVNVFKPGAFFPMSVAMNRNNNDYFFEAIVDTTVREAPVEDILLFLKKNPNVTYDLLSRVYRGTDGLKRRMAHLMGGKASSRLIFELLNAATRFGTTKVDGTIVLPLTENDISKRCGLSRETVNRSMRDLKHKQLVETIPGGIAILNREGLEATIGNQL